MTFALSDDECNGVSIAVNTILKTAFRIEEGEDWSAQANEWWQRPRPEYENKTAEALLPDNPEVVVKFALAELPQAVEREIGIFVMPTEEDKPPRAVFLVEVLPGMQAPIGGASYEEGAWRYPDGTEVETELAEALTTHAEELGVEWEH